MDKVKRFGVSLEKDLLKKFDSFIKKKNFPNRSEAIRKIIREHLVGQEWVQGKEIVGAITIVYDHHRRELLDKLVHVQHDFDSLVVSTQHVHLDHNNCFELIAIKGDSKKAEKLYNILKSTKGIKHAGFSMTTTGKDIP